MLTKLYKLNVALTHSNQFGVKQMSKWMKKLLPKKTFHLKVMDELNSDPETFKFHGGVQELLNVTRNNPESDLHFKGIGMMLYHMGKEKKYDNIVYKRIEMNLYKYKGLFPHRLAFGSFHGFINLNIKNPYMQDFLEKEFLRTVEKLTAEEAIEMIEAFGNNKVLTPKYKEEFIRNEIIPVIEKYFDTQIQYSYKHMINLFNALISAQFFDEAVFDKVVGKFVQNRRIRNLEKWVYILNKLIELNNGGNFPRKLDSFIDQIKTNIKSRDDYTWVYNVDENRYYTMQEMIAKREDYKYPDQQMGKYQFYPPEYQKNYQEYKMKGESELKKEEEEFKKQQALDDLMYDKFILAKLKEEGEDIDLDILDSKIELSLEKGEKEDREGRESSSDEEDEKNGNQKSHKKKKIVPKQRKGRQAKDERVTPIE